MPFVVRVRDFQSIGDTITIEVNGLTVITGPNNSGKTALMRALFGLFSNARGNSFVRYGKESARVEVEFSDRTIVWEKGMKVNRYVVDGKPLERVGAGVPAEVVSAGVMPVEAAGRELWPQFAQQFVGQIFLLNEPGSVLAEAIANVDKVGVLNEALRLSQSDRKSAASDLKLRNVDVAKHEESLRKFDGLEEVVVRVRKIEGDRKRILREQAECSELKSYRDRYESIRGVAVALAPVRAIPDPSPDLASKIVKTQKANQELRGYRDRYVAGRKIVSSLSEIRTVPTISDELPTRIRKSSQALEWARGISKRFVQVKSELETAKTATDRAREMTLPDSQVVLEARTRLEAARALATKWKTADQAVEALTAQLSSLTNEHSEAEKELASLFQQSGKCPYCGVNHEAHTH